METLLIALAAGIGFIIAYNTYGRWLGQKIFGLSPDTLCPSHRLNDGVDYVPTPKSVVFGHHFTSIAGTGPIVGPAIAIMWGWLPAMLWVVFGSIFIGAVHDFGALVVSLRNNGQTVGDIAGRLLNRRVRLLFLFILVMALTIVLAIFGLVIATVFRLYPSSIFPCVIQIPLAVLIGFYLHRKGAGLFWPSLLTLIVMYLTVIFGDRGVLHVVNGVMAGWPIWIWVVLLLGYSYVASVLPVWSLLQPRDYINSLQLISALGLIVLGLAYAAFNGGPPLPDGTRAALDMAAPAWNPNPKGAPLIFPFLFITIACGAISGFHCLVSSGTSSKQLKTEPDARMVGYGGMLTEGFLATLVILACGAGLGLGLATEGGTVLVGTEAWNHQYASWGAAGGLASNLGAFVEGSANFLKALGLGGGVAVALMGVLVASFAGTTLDTACRLQRYVIQELATFGSKGAASGGGPLAWLRNKHGATIFAVVIAALLAAIPPGGATKPSPHPPINSPSTSPPPTTTDPLPRAKPSWTLANAGKGGLILWPLFGATNQLLAGLSFLVITFYLWRRNKPVWFMVLPMIFMLVMPLWAMIWQIFVGSPDNPSWYADQKWLLVGIGLASIALEIWMIVEALAMFPRARGILESSIGTGAPEPIHPPA